MEAVASQPPVVSGAAAGVSPVAGEASITALPSVVEGLARFFMGLSSSSSLGAIGDIAGVTASAAVSGGAVCPATTAGGAATIFAAAVTPAGAGVLPAAPAAVHGVSGEQQRQVESRSRGRLATGPTDEPRSDPGGGILLLNALLVVGGDAIALPQIRLRKTELTSLLPELGVRMLGVGLPGIIIARLVLGRHGHL